jgi:FkbM family methyltransferase
MGQLNFTGNIESYYLGHQFGEMFKERIYDPFLVGRESLVIADIGSNIGIFTLYCNRFAKKTISVEPDPQHFADLKTNIEANNLKNVIPVNVAVADRGGEMDFYQNDNQTMNSLMPQIAQSHHKPIKVKVITPSELFKNEERIDFMKLDVEGKESDIIQSEDFIKVAPKISEIVLEIHSWNGRHPNQIKDAFKRNGYKVEVIPHQTTLWRAHRI